ncbi:MAG TPA: hypothetical protein VGB20_02010 [bacterium]
MSPLGSWWSTRSSRERFWTVLFVLAAGGFLGWRFLYRPRLGNLSEIPERRHAVTKEIGELRDVRQALNDQLAQLELAREAVARDKRGLLERERELVTTGELTRLVEELAKQGQGFGIAFEVIQQNLLEQAGRTEVMIELRFAASYDAIVQYLSRIERLSPYLRVVQLDVAEPPERPGFVGVATVSLVVPLRESAGAGGLAAVLDQPPPEPLALVRNPFVERAQAPDPAGVRKLRVTGITVRGAASTAIINDEVVRVGDAIEDWTVTRIVQDGVILSDGTNTHTVPLTPQ